MRYLHILMITFFVLLAGCGDKEIETNMSVKVADFEFMTQDNEKLSLDDLKGEWWVADFIFTKCTTVCLPMSTNLANLQKELKAENLNAKLVSFTVDPAFDQPDVLKRYAESYGADLDSWSFLTGYDYETIKTFSEESFLSEVREEPDSDQITHGVRFFLVNPEGEVIKNYFGIDRNEIDEIISDLKKIL